jgi:uncharacterized membrane protein
MTGNKEKVIGSVIIVVSLILAVVGYVILPETLTVQIGLDGKPSNTLPKLFALLIPLAISVIFSFMYMNDQGQRKSRNLFAAIFGIFISILMFVVNL